MSTVLHINGLAIALDAVNKKAQEVQFALNGKTYRFLGHTNSDGTFSLDREISPGVWERMTGNVSAIGKNKRVQLGALEANVSAAQAQQAASAESALSPVAPMPGLVRQVLVKAGEKVVKGQALVILEAMKLQMNLAAGGDAVVEAVLVKAGDMVAEGAELVRLKERA